ncbi:MAG: DUF4199 domain-containing protein [Dysgonamonadaceae bacterium]|jgi:hypothetical protein|nr:DUF4199 domain-containing protein [Dysgonamonadaceae bacterium]
MQEDKSQLIVYAMRFGLYIGAFWIIKYLFLVGSAQIPSLAAIELLLKLGTPVLLFYFLVKYRISVSDNGLGYGHGIRFAVMLFFFASLLEAVIVFAHTSWITPTYISDTYNNGLTMVKELGADGEMIDLLKSQPAPSPISYTFSCMMADVFWGLILALILVPVANQFNLSRKPDSDR